MTSCCAPVPLSFAHYPCSPEFLLPAFVHPFPKLPSPELPSPFLPCRHRRLPSWSLLHSSHLSWSPVWLEVRCDSGPLLHRWWSISTLVRHVLQGYVLHAVAFPYTLTSLHLVFLCVRSDSLCAFFLWGAHEDYPEPLAEAPSRVWHIG
jgi:hypothetical protein